MYLYIYIYLFKYSILIPYKMIQTSEDNHQPLGSWQTFRPLSPPKISRERSWRASQLPRPPGELLKPTVAPVQSLDASWVFGFASSIIQYIIISKTAKRILMYNWKSTTSGFVRLKQLSLPLSPWHSCAEMWDLLVSWLLRPLDPTTTSYSVPLAAWRLGQH